MLVAPAVYFFCSRLRQPPGAFIFRLAGNPASCSSGRRKVELSGKTTGFRYLSRNEPSPAAKAGAPPGLSSIAFRRNALPSQCDDAKVWEIPSKRRFRRTWPRKHCLPISSGPAAGISLAYLCPDLAAWLRHFVATSLLPSMRQGVGGLPPLFCPSQFAMPAKGVTFRYPLLPWDGVALSYPTDATICRTGAAVAPCDNGAAADRLAGVRISDAGGAASSCPNFGRLPRVSCYKMPRRRSCPVPYAHGCTVSSYSSIGRGSGI